MRKPCNTAFRRKIAGLLAIAFFLSLLPGCHQGPAKKGDLAASPSVAGTPPFASRSESAPATTGTPGSAPLPSRTAPASHAKKHIRLKTAIVAFTFDDGCESDYNCAFPLLKKYGIRGTSYIIGERPDTGAPFALSWVQIKEMKAYGWDFGCHTYKHTHMTTMTADEIRTSLQQEDQAFIRQGLYAPRIIAYPFGDYNQQVIDAVMPYRQQGRTADDTDKFVDLRNVNPYEINSVSADMLKQARLKRLEMLVDRACRDKAVIVFRTHCLFLSKKDDNGPWSDQTDSALFSKLVEYCVGKGCRFVTMTQLMALYS